MKLRSCHESRQPGRIASLLLVALFLATLAPAPTQATTPNLQPWIHTPGSCVGEAVLAVVTTGCGGVGTAVDTTRIYRPSIIRDVVTSSALCGSLGLQQGAPCYRMWYVGNDNNTVRRLGYAVSPDGIAWTRVPGSAGSGSVLGPG